jgi:hypothetical protein
MGETPGFEYLPPRPATDPPTPGATTTTRATSPEDYSAAYGEDERDGPGNGTTSGKSGPPRGSSDDGPQPDLRDVIEANAEAFEGLITLLVKGGGLLVDRRRSPQTHSWMMRPDEAEGIAKPLARIAARHSPVTMDGETTDVLDVLEAAGGLMFYGMAAHEREVLDYQEEQQAQQNRGQDFGPGV